MKKTKKAVKKVPKKKSTPAQREKRRASHWRKTGVSEATIDWMKKSGFL